MSPVESPTEPPTELPADMPTEAPTGSPTASQTDAPTDPPTKAPTESPTDPSTEAPDFEKESPPCPFETVQIQAVTCESFVSGVPCDEISVVPPPADDPLSSELSSCTVEVLYSYTIYNPSLYPMLVTSLSRTREYKGTDLTTATTTMDLMPSLMYKPVDRGIFFWTTLMDGPFDPPILDRFHQATVTEGPLEMNLCADSSDSGESGDSDNSGGRRRVVRTLAEVRGVMVGTDGQSCADGGVHALTIDGGGDSEVFREEGGDVGERGEGEGERVGSMLEDQTPSPAPTSNDRQDREENDFPWSNFFAHPTAVPSPAPNNDIPSDRAGLPCSLEAELKCVAHPLDYGGGTDCDDYEASLECYDQPKSITLMYTGGACSDSTAHQGGDFECVSSGGSEGVGAEVLGEMRRRTVNVKVMGRSAGRESDLPYMTLRDVSIGDTFSVEGEMGGRLLDRISIILTLPHDSSNNNVDDGDDTSDGDGVNINDGGNGGRNGEGGTMVQSLTLNTFCGGPTSSFIIGDVFGAFTLQSFVNDAQGSVPFLEVSYEYSVRNWGTTPVTITRWEGFRHGGYEDLLELETELGEDDYAYSGNDYDYHGNDEYKYEYNDDGNINNNSSLPNDDEKGGNKILLPSGIDPIVKYRIEIVDIRERREYYANVVVEAKFSIVSGGGADGTEGRKTCSSKTMSAVSVIGI